MDSLPTNSSHYTDTTDGWYSWYAVLIQSSLYALLALVAIVGNGLVIFLFTRHKTLRNLPNYLIVDLAIVDLLYSVINIPLSICYVVLNDSVYRGRTFAWIVSLLHIMFSLLSLTTMTLQMIDRYLAVCWPVFYLANKTKTKMLVIILVKWVFIISLTGLLYFPLYKIDLGSVPVVIYRRIYSRTLSAYFIRTVVYVCIFSIIVFAVLAIRKLRQPAHVLPAAVQNRNSPMARIRQKALYTILIVTFMCVASYLPMIIRSAVGFGFENSGKEAHLAAFAVKICLAIPSALNPFVYLKRVQYSALKVKRLKASLCGESREGNRHAPEYTGQGYIIGNGHITDAVQIKLESYPTGLTSTGSFSLPNVSIPQRATKSCYGARLDVCRSLEPGLDSSPRRGEEIVGTSVGSFPELLLVIEPTMVHTRINNSYERGITVIES